MRMIITGEPLKTSAIRLGFKGFEFPEHPSSYSASHFTGGYGIALTPFGTHLPTSWYYEWDIFSL
jgi:hypothetical protein